MTRAGAKLSALFVHCPHCTAELRAIPYFRGKNVACNQCDETFTLASRRLSFFASLVYRDEHHPEIATPSAETPGSNQSADEPAAVEAPQAAEEETTTPDDQRPETRLPESEPAEYRSSDSAISDLFEDETSLFGDDLNPDDAIILGESSDLIAEENFDRLIEEETGHWYCKVLGQTLGPMSLDELKELARNKQVERGDRVRCGEKGEWVSPLTIESLLPDTDLESLQSDQPTSPRTETAAPSVSEGAQTRPPGLANPQASMSVDDISSDSTRATPAVTACAVAEKETEVTTVSAAKLNRETTQVSAAPATRSRTSRGAHARTDSARPQQRNRLASVSKPAAQEKKAVWETPKSAPTIFGKNGITAAGVASVCVLVFGICYFGFGSSSLNSHLSTLESMATQFEQIREQKPSRAEWAKFQRQAMLELKPIVKDLSVSDGTNDPARQSLLRAARKHLPGMYVDSRYGASKSEESFHRDLEEAKVALNGRARTNQ